MGAKFNSMRIVATLANSRAFLLLLLAALLFQGTAIQGHVHFQQPALVSVAHSEQGSAGAVGKAESKAVCQLCVEAALSGHFLLAGANAAPEPPPQVQGVDPESMPEFRLLSSAIGWLSRAPPQ
jgi:hypothetical protein